MVKTTDELIEIRDEIYEKLYEKAVPSADYWELIEKEKSSDSDKSMYRLHYLPDDIQLNIIHRVCERHGLTKFNKDKITRSVLLGSAPMGNLEQTNNYREEAGLEPVEWGGDEDDE